MSLVSPYLFHLLAVAEAERNYVSPLQRSPQAEGKLTWGGQRGCAIFLRGSCDRFFPANTATARHHPRVLYITKCFQACSEVTYLQYMQLWILALSTVATFNTTVKNTGTKMSREDLA